MSSFYTTRSTTAAATAAAAGGGIASSITIEPSGRTQRSLSAMGTTIGSAAVGQSRHYCIALTNNPRMLRNAQRELAFAAASKPPNTSGQTTSVPPSPPQTRQRTASESRQQQQQVVPASTQPLPVAPITSSESRAYEQNIEDDFKAQIQPILQNYLNKTKRVPPVNLFLDMSPLIQY